MVECYAVTKSHAKEKYPAVVKRLRIVRFRTEKQWGPKGEIGAGPWTPNHERQDEIDVAKLGAVAVNERY